MLPVCSSLYHTITSHAELPYNTMVDRWGKAIRHEHDAVAIVNQESQLNVAKMQLDVVS
jgi:hypothetical protein